MIPRQVAEHALGPGMSVVPIVNVRGGEEERLGTPMSQSSTPLAADQAQWRPSVNPWLIAIAVMLATILEVLDTSVANVALGHIAGNLSASTDEATWVLTSYLVSNAIVLPMTGYLAAAFGRKRFLIGCIVVFTLASAACGAAASLGFLIFARVVQGAAGGALQPLSQAILMESFPPRKRGVAMAVFGMGVVVAPIIGPVLGGWITDNYSWRWVFYINIPGGILAVLMSQAFLEDPPYLRRPRSPRRARRWHRLRRHGPRAGHAASDPRPRSTGRLVQCDVDLLGRHHGDFARRVRFLGTPPAAPSGRSARAS